MSPVILHIETATQVCSVALSKDKEILAIEESFEKNAHSRNLILFIEKVFNKAKLKLSDLDAVAISKGPGSYTGLRIGVSTAKGLCYSLEKPLISVNTLQAMAFGASQLKMEDALYCPMIDARRMEVYTALYDKANNEIRNTRAEVIDENSFSGYLESNRICFFGDGAAKCKAVLGDKSNAVFIDDLHPSSRFMTHIALGKFENSEFEDVAYFEPFYLKDFIAGLPRVKGLK